MKPDLWINGEFVPWDKAGVHPLCHSLQRGSTLFESIDCNEAKNGKAAIFRLREHMIRLENSASIIGMPLPYTLDELVKASAETVARSGMKSCTIRPLALYSDVVMEVYPGASNVSVIIGLGASFSHASLLRVMISSYRKIDCSSMPVKAKVSGNYIGPMLAKTEAVKHGFDETIILDRDGFVAEGATSNIFIVENGALITAPADMILPGITRDSIMEIARERGIEVKEERFTPERLKAADEVILSSSGKGVAPIVLVDDTVIGNGAPGAITEDLSRYYIDVITGCVPVFEKWLTFA